MIHTISNPYAAPARGLVLFLPGGLEHFFLEIGDAAPGDVGPPDMANLAEAAARYDIEIPPPPG